MRGFKAAVTAGLAIAAGVVGLAPVAPGAALAAPAAADLGTTAASAAASCWEVKQARPTATSGAYWLLTSRMAQPQQFYCDMVTDGGGWVLVGKGRDGWTDDYLGKGAAADLLTPDLAPMSATTTQLSSRVIDALLDGGRVDALAEGIRLRRATNAAGTAWQEAQFRMARRDRWAWSFGAEHAVTSFSFDGRAGTGGTTASFGSDTSFRRVDNTPKQSNGYKLGFAFGASVRGTSGATSYLWSSANNGASALPYTQVYLRPRITSTTGFTALPDAGTAGWSGPAVPRSNALVSPWGVSGTAGSTAGESDVEVQAFTQSGNRMYVGGNFRYVQRDATGTDRVEQRFLAAFDVTTGEWVSSFRPVLDEQVRALATLPDGRVVAGGDFTQANGQPATAVAVLDPTTGATAPGWNLKIENRQAKQVLRVRALDVEGGNLYLGGNFTHFTGGTSATARYMKMLGRVSATNGTPASGWNPNLNGAVYAVDGSADGSRVYVAGHFTQANGVAARNAAAIMNTTGAPLATPTWSPVWSNASKTYQQAIDEVGGSVFVGGSEHSLFGFSTSTFARTSGSIMKTHGDVQAITDAGGVLYAGCHCDGWSYQDAYTWQALGNGWTQADTLSWFGAWDATTGARIPDFTPTFTMRLNRGIWALAVDSLGNVWAGGDIATVKTPSKAAQWSGGFARFPKVDSTAPATPTGLTASGQTSDSVTLSWAGVTDAGGGVRYQVLRDDRVVAFTTANVRTLSVPTGGSNRFFVRAVDGAGNYSATTAVLDLP
jgi:hypothetical protein